MTQRPGNESSEKFEYSETLRGEYDASMRRYIRPSLVFLPTMFLGLGLQNFHVPAPYLLVLLGAGLIVSLVMVEQTYRIQRRLNVKLKAERRDWETKHADHPEGLVGKVKFEELPG